MEVRRQRKSGAVFGLCAPKDEVLEESHRKDRCHYLGIAAGAGGARGLAPSLWHSLPPSSSFCLCPSSLSQRVLWPRPRNPACIF